MPARLRTTLHPFLAMLVGAALIATGATMASAAGVPVGLGAAGSFAVLGAETVTNTGQSVISGDLGTSPGTSITGFPPGQVVDGTIHSNDDLAADAQEATTTAYNDAAGRTATGVTGADLGGQTLVDGVYSGGAVDLTGTLTLDGQNDPASVFIFQIASTLVTAPSARVELINGASACNVFWQVTASATLDTDTTFAGTILALASITANTGADIEGRLLARTGAVTLDSNTVSTGGCAAVVPPTTTSTSTTSTSTTSTSIAPTTTSTSVAPTTTTTSVAPTTTTTETTSPPPPVAGPPLPPFDTPPDGTPPFGTPPGGTPPFGTPPDGTPPMLPVTGSTPAVLTLAGLALLALGGVLVITTRPTREPDPRR